MRKACLIALGMLILSIGGERSSFSQVVQVPVPEVGSHRDTVDLNQAPPYELRPLIQAPEARVYLNGVRLDTTRYRLDARRGHLFIEQALNPARDTLVAVYRTWPFRLKKVYRRRALSGDAQDSTQAATVVQEEEAEASDTEFDPFGDVKLRRSGSISRGILAGNRRDATVESGLRMQLSGEVTEGVEVEAVLTDENTPIQPEGTTQRLSDFDRVFVQLKHRQGTARLGDFDLNLDGGTFANFSRKLQGATVQATAPPFRQAAFEGGRVEVAGAVSRGEFRTQQIAPIDGVQGPYRLTGEQGEQFIIVVAGSETVYLDGEPLTRGKSNDYVIDYATGEINFTSNVLITEDRRITVEFQYRTNRFSRTLMASEGEADFWRRGDGSARGHLAATVLREADSRQFQGELNLTAQDSLRIAQAGDEQAFRSGAERVEYDAEAPYVQYVREPNPAGTGDSIFVPLTRQPSPGEQVYRVRFSRVGSGEGSYERVGRASSGVAFNGIAYEYRGPGQGNYVPRRPLPRPQEKQVIDLRGHFEPLPGVELFGEWGHSLNDRNRLSQQDDGDNRGGAYRAGLRLQPTSLAPLGVEMGTVSASFRRRRTGRHFASFDRIRPVEFERRWNLGLRGESGPVGEELATDEVIDEGTVQWEATDSTHLQAEWGRLRRGNLFNGTRRALDLSSEETGWPTVDYELEYLTSRDALQEVGEDGAWLRQRGTVKHSFWKDRLVPRLEVEQERRRQRVLGTDSLSEGSLAFVEYRPGLQYRSQPFQLGGEVAYRTEERWAEDGTLRNAARSWTAQSNVQYRPVDHFSTEMRLGYRRKQFTDYFRIEQRREDVESLLLRWRTRYRPLDRALELEGRYEGRTERTPTLQEIYVQTGPELGQYVWEDQNGDDVVQLDEFLPERSPNEGTYVKTFVPSDSLTSVVNVEARLRMRLQPGRLWRQSDQWWKRWLSYVDTRTTFEVTEKSRDPHLLEIYALNLQRYRDPVNTLNGRLRIGQDVTFFRRQPRYGMDVSFNQVHGLNELAAGQERRFLNHWGLEGRWQLARHWTARLNATHERNRTISEAFDSRTYDIESLSLKPELTFRPIDAMQVTTGVEWAQKEDAEVGQRARLLKVPVETRLTQVQRLQLRASAELASVSLQEGEEAATGLTQFELTDGRGPGTSVRWRLSGQYRINEYLRGSLSYDGRAPAAAPIVHTVRANVSATF